MKDKMPKICVLSMLVVEIDITNKPLDEPHAPLDMI